MPDTGSPLESHNVLSKERLVRESIILKHSPANWNDWKDSVDALTDNNLTVSAAQELNQPSGAIAPRATQMGRQRKKSKPRLRDAVRARRRWD